ncbi:hypothetical protein V6N13_003096 [Hibiscus sabdariffa]
MTNCFTGCRSKSYAIFRYWTSSEGISTVASQPGGKSCSLSKPGNGKGTNSRRVATLAGTLGSLLVFPGVETKETLNPARANCRES